MEHAEQTGDFNAYLGLWSSEKAAEMEKMRSYVRPRPEVRYTATKAFVRGNDAVLLVQGGPDSFVTMFLRKDRDQWKIRDQAFRNTPPDPNSVYALLPPEPGAFTRAGSPWDQIAASPDQAQAARLGFQMKAVFDDSYLYIRIQSATDLPAPGSTVAKPPGGWPVLKIGVTTVGEFVLYDAVNVGDQATFDTNGRANSHRAYASYMIRLERNKQEVFSAAADLQPSPLLDVTGRNYDIRLPLAAMGITDPSAVTMTLGDAQWPKSVLVSLNVPRFQR